LLVAVCSGAICSVIFGGVVVGAISLVGDRPVTESAVVFAAILSVFAVAGAFYGIQAWRETPTNDRDQSDA